MAETDWVYLDKDPYAMPGDSNTDLVYYIDPQDGEEPFCYWWEDMRPKEVVVLIKEAYEQGKRAGMKCANNQP